MAYTTINKSSLNFNTKIYAGNATNNATVTGVGFQSNFTWLKAISGSQGSQPNWVFDSVRGATKPLVTNSTAAEDTEAGSLKSWQSDGFTLGTNNEVNGSSTQYVSWNWKAGTSFSNSAGANGASIASTGSINTTAGFSIIKYTGGGSAGATVNHGLGAVPKMIILKRLADSGYDWVVYHKDKTAGLYLNNTNNNNDSSSNNIWFNGAAPTSQVFTIGSDGRQSNSGKDYLAYCFKDVQGYSKFGSYTGNGQSNDGQFIYTGFKPAFVMTKRANGSDWWVINDNKRDPFNASSYGLRPNENNAQSSDNAWTKDLLSNGFKHRNNNGGSNASGGTYIYMAIAEAPLVGSNNVPATAR